MGLRARVVLECPYNAAEYCPFMVEVGGGGLSAQVVQGGLLVQLTHGEFFQPLSFQVPGKVLRCLPELLLVDV